MKSMGNAKTLPDHIINAMDPNDRKTLGIKLPAEARAAYAHKAEAKLQTALEQWLQTHGYWTRSPDNIDAGPPPRGWRMHLHETKRNPLMLDVLILANTGHFLELELKTPTGTTKPHQAKLISFGAPLARDLKTAVDTILQWETLICDEQKKTSSP
jgi:hypothetical protein